MPSFFQIFLAVLAIFSIFRTSRQYHKHQVSTHWFVLLILFWIIVVGVAYIPQTADVIAQSIGVERAADLLVYCSVLALFYGLYRTISRAQKQHQEITQLVRRIGILETTREERD